MIKVSDYIIGYLASLGIKDVFYVPGGGAMHLNNSLGENIDIEAVSMIFEQGAAIAAEAYARARDGFGACLVTSGPGATNALTGLVGAYIDSIPVIFISGQVKRDDLIGNQGLRQFGIQEVDIISMVGSYSKYAVQIQNPEDIVYEMQKAAAIAVSGRPGPVWIDVPLDIQASHIDVDLCRVYHDTFSAKRYAAGETVFEHDCQVSNEQVDKVIELLNQSKKPILYIGHGIRLDHSVNEIKELIDALGIPVLTSWNGVDLIAETHPLYVGRPGSVGHRHANMVQHKADLVITIGTRLNLLATGYNYDSFLENAIHVMVDIDEAEINKKSIHPEVKIVASAHSFITALLKRCNEVEFQADSLKAWKNECKELKDKYPIRIPEQSARDGFVSNYDLIEEISKQMKGNDIYQFTSSGTTVDIAMKVFEIKDGQRAFLTKGLAAMGYDVPASIGSAIALLKRENAGQVVCVSGDGSVAMNLQELQVIAQRQLPVKLFVSDNSGYSMIYGSQKGNFHRLTGANPESGLSLPNMESVANGFGIQTFHIDADTDLKEAISEVLKYEGPAVCRVITDIEQKILPRQANYMKEDGQMASRPLYDMAPFVELE